MEHGEALESHSSSNTASFWKGATLSALAFGVLFGITYGGVGEFVQKLNDLEFITACDRATTAGSPWIKGSKNYATNAVVVCTEKLNAGYVPCSVNDDERHVPYFCSTPSGTLTSGSETVTIFFERCTNRWSPHCALSRIDTRKKTELTFY